MTLQSDLDQLTNDAIQLAEDTAENFVLGPGKTGLIGFLQREARKGLRSAKVHIDRDVNPSSRIAGGGFATLSGELAYINDPTTPGVQVRNGVCWMYLGMTPAGIAGFEDVVEEMVDDLVTNEDLTVTSVIGATVADLEISW